ncbi:type II toxin-antitoxin system death-on-curing family toxin [Pontiella agarivorans]|uniref:Type II toxin-antitoxin system death-on-curing family toxin n=1 Tax=Pontiella agarivorans TaxID=3038953 RepID=A0ABU5N0G5_9BACT|nr:type II toxin-antitoxin system death-on-curing family toxin [Pontiella agarivorans]MDZ8119932.1 type II toxin-antitoxin system death-on-curing family toxin [Pontiella agarivorans]
MNQPRWISARVIHAVHEELLARFGGLSGVRDQAMLESALDRPKNSFHYSEPTIYSMASDYAVGIVKNHPFVDGNKRTGFMAAYIFLMANGKKFQASEESTVLQTLALAAGEIDGTPYAAWLEASCEAPE